MTDTLTFDLTLNEKIVNLMTDSGEVQALKLTELTGEQRDRWMTMTAKRIKTDTTGNTNLSSFDGIQASLISIGSTYDGGPNSGQSPSVDDVNKWPAKVTKSLFELLQQMSGLDEEALEREGN